MAVGKNTQQININGGGTLYINTDINETVLPGGGTPTNPWDDLGYLDESGTTLNDTEELEEIRDETGEMIKTFSKNRKLVLSTILLQTGKDEVDYIENNKNADLQAYYQVPVADGVKTQKWLFPKVRILPNKELVFGTNTRKLALEIHVLKKDSTTEYYTVTEV